MRLDPPTGFRLLRKRLAQRMQQRVQALGAQLQPGAPEMREPLPGLVPGMIQMPYGPEPGRITAMRLSILVVDDDVHARRHVIEHSAEAPPA